MFRALVPRFAIFFLLQGLLLFVPAGRIDLPFFWAYIGLMVVALVGVAATIDRDLLQERFRPGPGGTDRQIRAMIMPFMAGASIVAGLDARFGWSRVPFTIQAGAFASIVASMLLVTWAMHVNRFFSPVVRIQSERGHRVIDDGPYRLIRHPGYLGAVIWFAALGPALGSWWAIVPALGGLALIVRRAVIEDRFLRSNLDGYADYAVRVDSRMIPGVW